MARSTPGAVAAGGGQQDPAGGGERWESAHVPILSAPGAGARRSGRTVGAVVGEGDDGVLEGLDHVGLVVSDMSRSVRWYREVMGLRRA